MDKVIMIIEGDFGGDPEGRLDVFKVMDTFHKMGIEVHSYEEGVYYGVVCREPK